MRKHGRPQSIRRQRGDDVVVSFGSESRERQDESYGRPKRYRTPLSDHGVRWPAAVSPGSLHLLPTNGPAR
jgi:hypothetical protein